MKYKGKKPNKISLSDKIADALTVKPKADIEDDHIFNTKPKTVSRADFSSSGSEDEAVISDFRKRNVNLLSEISKKYEGQVVSRKDLHLGSDESGDEESGLDDGSDDGNKSNDYSISKIHKQINSDAESNDSHGNSDAESEEESNRDNSDVENDVSGDENDEGKEDNDGYDISQMDTPVQESFEHVKKQNISEEAKKGICVRNQLLLWEGLLEMRIHLQKCINSANMMPFPDLCQELKQTKEFDDESQVAVSNITNTLDKLLTLQSYLLRKFPETKSLLSTKETKEEQKQKDESDEEIPSDTDNEEIPSDTENEDEAVDRKVKDKDNVIPKSNGVVKKRKLIDYENDIADSHKKLKTFRDSTIQKWNEKTRIAVAANMKNAPTNIILQQISYLLSDRNKLIRRTQLKRSDYDIIGYKKDATEVNEVDKTINPITRDRKDNDEYIAEIFDDSDFYHQLLRELIECKSADISDPIQLSRQWITLQQMRGKMKRKVDTKATKGRKIKYVVHNKLVNYMAPEKSTKWHEESTNELYSSLFGKMFEHNNVGLNVNLENISPK